MAHKKAGGSTSLGRDSQGQRLGVKLYAGQKVMPGMVIIRQRGTKWRPGQNVKMGNDDTIYALKEGIIKFYAKKRQRFDGNLKKRTFVAVAWFCLLINEYQTNPTNVANKSFVILVGFGL